MKLIQEQGAKKKVIKCKNCEATNFQEPEIIRINNSQFKMIVFRNECRNTNIYIYSNSNKILKRT